jgi:hypothetical protein
MHVKKQTLLLMGIIEKLYGGLVVIIILESILKNKNSNLIGEKNLNCKIWDLIPGP